MVVTVQRDRARSPAGAVICDPALTTKVDDLPPLPSDQFWGLTHHAHARTGCTKANVDDFEARRVSLSRLINYCDQPHPTRERTGSEHQVILKVAANGA
jgi:hypothetical protein